MQRHHTIGSNKPGHLLHQNLWLRNVDENQPRGREIEGLLGQARPAPIGMQNIDVRQMALCHEATRTLHLLITALHADNPARRADASGEKAQTPLRATSNLDHAPACLHTDLVEQPVRIGGKFFSLSPQAILLRLPVAKKVGVRLAHCAPPRGYSAQHKRRNRMGSVSLTDKEHAACGSAYTRRSALAPPRPRIDLEST